MSLTALAFWVTYATGILAAVFNPVAGMALYILVYHLNPETQWWGQSVQALGVRTSMIVAVATAVGILVRRPRLEYGARQFPLPYVLAILLALIAAGSLTWGVAVTDRGLYYVEKFAKLLICLFLMLRCVRTPLHYHIVVYSWLLGVLYLGYYARGSIGQTIGGRLTAGLGGPDFAESSGLAVHLVATLPLIGATFFMARRWWGRLFALLVGALTVNTIVMTRTRNALVGLAAMTLVGVLALPRRYRLKGMAAIAGGALLAVFLIDPGWWTRMATIHQYQSDSAAMRRLVLWRAAWDMVCDHPLGVGLGNYQDLVMDYVPGLTIIRSTHNTPLLCLAELGWLGLLVFAALFCVTFWRLRAVGRTARTLPDNEEIRLYRWTARFHLGWHTMALKAALAGYLACAMFTARLLSEDLWLLLGLAACLYNVSKHMVGKQHAPVRQPSEAAGLRATRAAPPPAYPPCQGGPPMPPRTDNSVFADVQQRRLGAILVLAIVGSTGLNFAIVHPVHNYLEDFRAFYAAAWALHSGVNPYDIDAIHQRLVLPGSQPIYYYPYPPPSLLVVYPFGLLPYPQAQVPWCVLSFLLALIALSLLCNTLSVSWGSAASLLLVYSFLLSNSVFELFRWGQFDMVVLTLLTLAFLCFVRERPSCAGLFVGLAALAKVTPVVLLGVFLIRREWKALGVGIATIALALLASYPIIGGEGFCAWWAILTDKLGTTYHIIAHNNMSLHGYVYRALVEYSDAKSSSTPWINLGRPIADYVVWLAIAGVGLTTILWMWRHRRALNTAECMAAAVPVILMVAPITWTHHTVTLLVPVAFLLALAARQERLPGVDLAWIAAIILLWTVWPVQRFELHLASWLDHLLRPTPTYTVFLTWLYMIRRYPRLKRAILA